MITVKEYQDRILSEINQELRDHSPVVRNFKHISFVSKSKGIRNGKRRMRTHWKETHLIKYFPEGRYHLSNNFPWDEVATEVFSQLANSRSYRNYDVTEILKEEVLSLKNKEKIKW